MLSSSLSFSQISIVQVQFFHGGLPSTSFLRELMLEIASFLRFLCGASACKIRGSDFRTPWTLFAEKGWKLNNPYETLATTVVSRCRCLYRLQRYFLNPARKVLRGRHEHVEFVHIG